MKKTFSIFLLALLASFLVFGIAQAVTCRPPGVRTGCPTQGLVPCGTPCCPCTLCDFFIMFDRLVRVILFMIIPVIAVLMIAIGGFMMLVAYGGPAEVIEGKKGGPQLLSQAKSLFKAVAWGLLIAYGAWIIVNTFFTVIGVAEWTGLKEGWFKIECEPKLPPGCITNADCPQDQMCSANNVCIPKITCSQAGLPKGGTGCNTQQITSSCNNGECNLNSVINCKNTAGEDISCLCKKTDSTGSWECIELRCTTLPNVLDPLTNCEDTTGCLRQRNCPTMTLITCIVPPNDKKECTCLGLENRWSCSPVAPRCTNLVNALPKIKDPIIDNCTPNTCLINRNCPQGKTLQCVNIFGDTKGCTCMGRNIWQCE